MTGHGVTRLPDDPDERLRLRRVLVAVCTYRRPRELAALLPIVVAQARASRHDVRLVVVDNDPAGDPSVVRLTADQPCCGYAHEPDPGIAAARNRALALARSDELLVFVDDDERPREGWLDALVETFGRYRCTGVVGATVPVFDEEPDPWIRAGGFFDRPRTRTGATVPIAATNNLLLDVAGVRQLGLRFDGQFGLSGGSDSLFTSQLSAAGGRLVWCDEAVVDSPVPVARATRRWVLQRQFRYGNASARIRLVTSPGRFRSRSVECGRGGLRVGGGAARLLLGVVLADVGARAGGSRTAAHGAGMLAAAVGYVAMDYRRDAEASKTGARAPLRVLQSVPPPDPETNPYVIQLVEGCRDHVAVDYFTWRRALLGRYDVLHLHWPEVLCRRRGRPARAAATAGCALLLLRVRLVRPAVVRTLHNEAPHEDGGRLERRFLGYWDRLVTLWILLTPTPNPHCRVPPR